MIKGLDFMELNPLSEVYAWFTIVRSISSRMVVFVLLFPLLLIPVRVVIYVIQPGYMS